MHLSEYEYPRGITEFLEMFKGKTFDRERALNLIEKVSDINQPILDLGGYSSTYLYEAESCNNIEAVRFLLENGADPNFCDMELTSWCALDDLHFLWPEMCDEAEQRINIAKLFFEFGGDPNLLIDGETLYDHVLWEVFNFDHVSHDREYLLAFFKLLIAYGGGGGKSYAPKPKLSERIDVHHIDNYKIKFVLCEDGYHLKGHLINSDGIVIGII